MAFPFCSSSPDSRRQPDVRESILTLRRARTRAIQLCSCFIGFALVRCFLFVNPCTRPVPRPHRRSECERRSLARHPNRPQAGTAPAVVNSDWRPLLVLFDRPHHVRPLTSQNRPAAAGATHSDRGRRSLGLSHRHEIACWTLVAVMASLRRRFRGVMANTSRSTCATPWSRRSQTKRDSQTSSHLPAIWLRSASTRRRSTPSSLPTSLSTSSICRASRPSFGGF